MGNVYNFVVDTSLPHYGVNSESGGYEKRDEVFGEVMEGLLDEFRVHLAVKYRKYHSYKTYFNAVKRFLDFTDGRITRESIDGFRVHLNRNYKQNTISMYILGLDLLLEYLGLEHLHVPIPQGEDTQRDTIDINEIKQVLKAAKQLDVQTYAIVRFVTDFDCRPHEITRAEWSWIRGNKIYFSDCKTGNNYGFITDDLKKLLERLKKWQRYRSKKYIFVNQSGRYRGMKLSDNTWVIRETVKQLTKKVIGRCLTPQDLRASVITEEYNHYINPKTIQRKARHRSQKTTLKYNHVDDKQLVEYIEKGTIFGLDNSWLSKPVSVDKRSCINSLPQDFFLPLDGEGDREDNSSFSFSTSFFDMVFGNFDLLEVLFFVS